MARMSSEKKIRSAFCKVFKIADPFGRLFNDVIKHKVILCPTDGYHLNKEQFQALMETIKVLGESSFYARETEEQWPDDSDGKTYSFRSGELSNTITYKEYKDLKIVLENALYSTNGSWGIIISHEDHGVIGGNSDFIKIFKALYPQWNQGCQNFIQLWEANKAQYNSNLNWLPDFLKYINQL
jgi:hypothetical protein